MAQLPRYTPSMGDIIMIKNLAYTLVLNTVLFSPTLSVAEPSYPFSRLFTTEAERVYLDNLKKQINNPKNTSHTTSETSATSDGAKKTNTHNDETLLRLSGFIKRSDGQQQVWVNEKKLVNSDYLSGQLSSGKKSAIRLKTKGKQTFIKVGQSWNPPKDEIIHVYKKK